MELRDYLDILKRRKNILIAVPAVAALLVVGLIVVKPKQYQATATVAAPALVGGASSNQYSGANGPKSFVANFTAAVTSPPIVDQVSRETGVPKSRVKSGLTANEIGTSSLMQVTYATPKHKEAFNVAQAAAARKQLTAIREALTGRLLQIICEWRGQTARSHKKPQSAAGNRRWHE